MKRKPSGYGLAIGLAVALTLAFMACGKNGSTDPNINPDPSDTLPVPIDTSHTDTTRHPLARNCLENPVVFTSPLIDPSFLKVVTPIGQVGGGNTEIIGRSYVFPKDDKTGQRLPLMAPADMEVVAVGHYIPPGAPTVAQGYDPDWVMLIDLGCGLHIELYHVKEVVDSIKAAMFDTAITTQSGYLQLRHKVAFKAGDTFGAYIKGLNSGAFDFILRSDSLTNRFSNQARYEAGPSNLLHVLCPYDLFQGSTKAAYYALLGTVSGIPIPGAGCGTVERDKAGTPSGQWFFDSSFTPGVLSPNRKEGYYGDPLPIVLGPDSTVYIGHTGPTDNIRIDRLNPTWKDPASITDGWCYQLYNGASTEGWLWFKMASLTKMNVAYNPTGTCPSAFPTAGFRVYYR